MIHFPCLFKSLCSFCLLQDFKCAAILELYKTTLTGDVQDRIITTVASDLGQNVSMLNIFNDRLKGLWRKFFYKMPIPDSDVAFIHTSVCLRLSALSSIIRRIFDVSIQVYAENYSNIFHENITRFAHSTNPV
jgi:hypothetical protein